MEHVELQTDMRQFLEDQAKAIESVTGQGNSLAGWVLRYGLDFEWQKLPRKFSYRERQNCFNNSQIMVLDDFKELVYVEGYAARPDMPIPVAHGWAVERGSRKVIDVTSRNLRAYIGVPIQRSYLQYHRITAPVAPCIDNWEQDYPLIRMSEEELREKVLEKLDEEDCSRASH